MSKSIWCVMTEDSDNWSTTCLGCYESEQEADKAWAYWDSDSDHCVWIAETTLYGNLEDTLKELEIA